MLAQFLQLRWKIMLACLLIGGIISAQTPNTPGPVYQAMPLQLPPAATPADGITLIESPAADQLGAANLSHGIKLPPARQGHAPNLVITYSSDAQHGWLGRGWGLDLPTIDVETRWGVPRFSSTSETETYLFMGDMLAPVAHRGETRPRTADLSFQQRVETDFLQITRHGDSPRNYWWEVEYQDGMVEYYGGTPGGVTASAVLRDEAGNIASWAITQSWDVYGNRIDYNYVIQQDNGREGSRERGTYRYPTTITYNGFLELTGPYEITFLRDRDLGESLREDKRIDFTSGYKMVVADRLRRVEIRYRGELVRHYELTYRTGAFQQTLLTSLAEFGSDGSRLSEHEFEYHDLPSGSFSAFGPEEEWSSGDDNVAATILNPIPGFTGDISALGGASSTSNQVGGAATIGPIGPPASKELTVGGTFGSGSSEGLGELAFVDINGDLLPDKVFRRDDALWWRENLFATGVTGFGPLRPISGIREFSRTRTSETNLGFEANITPFFAGYENTTSRTSTTTYFSDFNGDDLIDVVIGSRIWFNRLDGDGNPSFTTNSGETPSPIIAGASPDEDLVTVDPADQQELIDRTPLHDIVRSWEAPFAGTVSISGTIALLEQAGIDEYTREDGVRVTIETQIPGFAVNAAFYEATIPANDYAPRVPTGVNNISVRAGQRIYFRVKSIQDGAFDRVSWDPEITYLNQDLGETDLNGLANYRYRASDDFLLASCQTVVMPLTGSINIESTFTKPVLSDSLELQLLLGNQVVESWVFGPDSIVSNLPLNLADVRVRQDQMLQLRMRAAASIDWTAPKWSPVITYALADDGTQVTAEDGAPLYRYCPAIDYTMRTKIIERTLPITPTADSLDFSFEFASLIPFGADETDQLSLVVRTRDTTLYRRDTTLGTAPAAHLVNWAAVIPVEPGEELFIEAFTNARLGPALRGSEFTLARGGNIGVFPIGKHRMRTANEMIFGPQFRGWGQFVYRGAGEIGDLPIQENLLALPNPDIEEEDIEDIEIDEDDPDFSEFEGLTDDPTQEQFVVMVAEPKDSIWRGYDALTFVGRNFLSSSRLGEDDVILTPDLGTGAGAPPLSSISKMEAIAGGAGFGPFSLAGSSAWNTTTNLLDVMDLNGDRYPDLVTPQKVQYTTVYGGLSEQSYRHGFGGHEANSMAIGGTAGGRFVHSSTTNSGDTSGKGSRKRHRRSKTNSKNQGAKAQSANETAEAGGSISVQFSRDEDYTEHSWMDINGDGLTDKVWSNGDVAFNHGYRFGPRENWGFNNIRSGVSIDYGGGGGVNVSNNSFAAGFAVSRTDNYSETALQDVNGDGMADALVYNPDNNTLRVAINTGVGFQNFQDWAVLSDQLDKGDATAESLNFAFTVCIPIFFIRICVNPSGSAGRGASRVLSQFNDIDGDGYLDELLSTRDNSITVRRSTLGKVNLLRQVRRPLGGTLSLDYANAANDYGLPFPKWVLSQTSLADGQSGDGPEVRKTRFSYRVPAYDRHEREFYGFCQTTTEELDTEANDAVYRRSITEYQTGNYYNRGLVSKEYLEDAEGGRFREIEYSYEMQNPETGTPLAPNLLTSDTGRGLPAMTRRTERFYEGEASPRIIQSVAFTYDELGRVLTKVDFGDGTPEDELRTEYTYHPLPAGRYLTNRIQSIEMYGGGTLLRRTELDVDDQGNITQMRQFLDESTAAVYDYTYDEYGNVLTATRPPNQDGDRLTYTYTIDSIEHVNAIETSDSYGYTSTASFEYRYGHLTAVTDINGQTMRITPDAHGRVSSILFPKDSAFDYSLRYTYFPEATTPYAVSERLDPRDGSDVPTVIMLDGLGRIIQEQFFSVVEGREANVVSGNLIYDAFDRPVNETYAGTTAPRSTTRYLAPAAAPRNTVEYDVLDRPTKLIFPDGSVSTMEYGFIDGPNGLPLFQEKLTDALGNQEITLTDERGRREGFLRQADSLSIETYFEYDVLGNLLSVTDNGGFRTEHRYDLLGRRYASKSADGGWVEKTFDLADNIISKLTPNLRELMGERGGIQYTYDHERLTTINFPINFQNKAEFSYGGPAARFNRAGRIVLRQDASGGEEYFFDEHGEVRKTIRTMLINESTAKTFVAEATYDSWGREIDLTYPDGEVLTYGYDASGQLTTLTGEKFGRETPYLVDARYDEFERMTARTLGNGTQETMEYNPLTRRPSAARVEGPEGLLQDLNFTYDLVGNLERKSQPVLPNSELGVQVDEQFTYDPLHRLAEGVGNFSGMGGELSYTYLADYDGLYNQTRRELSIVENGTLDSLRSYDQFTDVSPSFPHRIRESGGRPHFYDANGNLLGFQGRPGSYRYQQSRWDEEDRLMEFSDNGTISRYTYAADGERAIQSTGAMKGVFTEGAPAGFVSHSGDYTAYVSPFFTFSETGFTKHYFMNGVRLLSKEGTGEFNNIYWPYGGLTAGDLNYTARMNDLTATVWNYFNELGLPPGPPTLPGYYGQPLQTGNPLPTSAGGDFGSLPGLSTPRANGGPEAGGPPGPPTWYTSPPERDSIGAGYGYEGFGAFPEVALSYYHQDQLGNITWVTDNLGRAKAYRAFLPNGEALIEQERVELPLDYSFNGKEEDAASGLHYFGARYLDAQAGNWLSIDPLADAFPGHNPYAFGLHNPLRFIDPDGREAYDLFGSEMAAAVDFARIYNKRSIQRNWEFGSKIYQTKLKGRTLYFYDRPKTDRNSSAVDLPKTLPRDHLIADIHTHSRMEADADGYNFHSHADERGNITAGTRGYVAVPNGELKVFDPVSRRTDLVASGLPFDESFYKAGDPTQSPEKNVNLIHLGDNGAANKISNTRKQRWRNRRGFRPFKKAIGERSPKRKKRKGHSRKSVRKLANGG